MLYEIPCTCQGGGVPEELVRLHNASAALFDFCEEEEAELPAEVAPRRRDRGGVPGGGFRGRWAGKIRDVAPSCRALRC